VPAPHLLVLGPTASGKSALALALAQRRAGVEIVSLDSMQVYRGMDIGTAKPSPAERAEVPHHLVDVAGVDEDWSVVRMQQAARAAVADIERRNGTAVLVGGTGLYVQAVVDDLRIPAEDLDLRARLVAQTSEPGGVLAAHRRLRDLDPVAAARIDEHNQRRIVRALEVIELTGRPFSSFGPGIGRFGDTVLPVLMVGIWLPRAVLARRIEARLRRMARDGLVDEVRALADRDMSRTARQAIGYKEILDHIEHPDRSTLDDALDLAARRTRSFARRQRMWFRRDPRVVWFGCREDPAALVDAVAAAWPAPERLEVAS
jgi:tRNA dimethylallyltransferase